MDKEFLNYIGFVFIILSITGNYFVIKKSVKGFYFWSVANVGWIIINFAAGLWSEALLFILYLFFAVWGIVSWKKKED